MQVICPKMTRGSNYSLAPQKTQICMLPFVSLVIFIKRSDFGIPMTLARIVT